ncbi:MAG: MMPL family transporter [Thermoanaerobaculia bacterium]|nr:MMPL family transporter [Thermoanaerobaculia bacterium]
MRSLADGLVWASRLALRWRRGTFVAWGLAVLVALVGIFTQLQIATSNLDLVSPDLPEVRAFRRVAESLGTPNVLVVVLEGGEEDSLDRAVATLESSLRALPEVRSVLARLPYDSRWLAMLGLSSTLRSHDGRARYLFVQPADPESRAETIEPMVHRVRSVLTEAHLGREGIRAGTTGIPQYALDDKETIQHDVSRLSLVSLGLVAGLFAWAFSSWRRPLIVIVALAISLIVTLGVLSVFPGRLTLLSAFVGSILFGLGVDFGIHLIDRIEEIESADGYDGGATLEAIRALAPGLATGALTTASAFMVMTVSGFRGFAELGFAAAVAVLVSLTATVTLVPAVLAGQRAPTKGALEASQRFRDLLIRIQHPAVAVGCVVLALGVIRIGMPGFDTDYMNLQAAGSETVRLEREMVENSDYSPQFAVSLVENREALSDLVQRLRREPTVERVESVLDLELLSRLPVVDVQGAADLRRRFVTEDGHYAVYSFPAENVWESDHQESFLKAVQRIDPEITGIPVLGEFMMARTRRALKVTAVLGGLVVFAWVFVDFKRWIPSLLAVLPTILGVGILLTLMRLLGLQFNPLNVMALPAVLGIAVDDGVHLVHRFLKERGDLDQTLLGTGRAVVLTSFTSIAAFAALLLTQHRGLASFAAVLCLGTASALVVSIFVLPGALGAARTQLIGDREDHSPYIVEERMNR